MDERSWEAAGDTVRRLMRTPVEFVVDQDGRCLRSRDPVVTLQLDPHFPDAPLWIVRCGEMPPVSLDDLPDIWVMPPEPWPTGIAGGRQVSFWDPDRPGE